MEYRPAAESIGERRFAISHRSGPLPLLLVSFRQDLDHSMAAREGAGRSAPQTLLQDYLNVSSASYGLVSNGYVLRLLRDNASLTRQAYLEFDLRGMLEGGVYADFVLLYLVLQRSRLPQTAEGACWLERWREKAETQGARALGELRRGVEAAITTLGSGFLTHPANDALRQRLHSGALSTPAYYQQLLRLIYRLIFLFAAEERGLIFPPGSDAADRRRYMVYYSASRLRAVAPRQRSDDRHDDLWRTLRLTFGLVSGERQGLSVPALGGGLFDAAACPDLDSAALNNAALAQAVQWLSTVQLGRRGRAGLRRRVNYRDMNVEELGGVYEGLLEQQPQVTLDGLHSAFTLVGSGQRKQTGSYYTPEPLVRELVRTALEPVITERLALTPSPSPNSGRGETHNPPGGRGSVPSPRIGRGLAERSEARVRDRLLAIAVCDPACGSGHFLLAAARRLALEVARLDAGGAEPGLEQRRSALREVIRHCLYGVDANPLAVDLCKLALWLEGHEPGRPLTFLDHRIKLGNSLIGASWELLAEGLPDGAFDAVSGDDRAFATALKQRNKKERPGQLSLLAPDPWQADSHALGQEMQRIGDLPEDAAPQVYEQRAAYVTFNQERLERARAALDAWTAAFFWPLQREAPPPTNAALTLAGPATPPALSPDQQQEVQRLRHQHAFFHWPLEFADIFDEERGGFDCVLGNPPWERIKLQEQEFFAERDDEIATAANKAARDALIATLPKRNPRLDAAFRHAQQAAMGMSKFVRASGRFPLTAVGDVNLYPLFAEHDRNLLNPRGRAGIIVPTGIATDDSTKRFFQSVVEADALASLFDIENRDALFPGVHRSYKFCLLTLSGRRVEHSDLAFMLASTDDLRDERRRFQLGPADFALLNPNTRTCPIFRTGADAELTRAIYRRVPVLIDERTGANPWGVRFATMFHMSNDSGLFHSEPGPDRLPLYEGKLFHQFNHRWATYEPWGDVRDVTPLELADPRFAVTPRYWVDKWEMEERLRGKWVRGWLLAFRDIARSTDERTAIFSVLPRAGVGNNAPLFLANEAQGGRAAAVIGCLNSLVFDYSARPKVGGTHLNFFVVNQFAVLPPSAYTPADLAFIVPRVLELVYTAWDLQPFAKDLGYDGAPFAWDEERRAVLRAELDAWYAALYGLTRDELRYVLDPSDVYGPEFPGETFRVLKSNEIKRYGEYRTRRLVLAAWDRLGLGPRLREGRYEAR